MKHPLIALTNAIDWSYFEEAFAPYYSEVRGRTGAPIRLIGWRPKVVTADLGYQATIIKEQLRFKLSTIVP